MNRTLFVPILALSLLLAACDTTPEKSTSEAEVTTNRQDEAQQMPGAVQDAFNLEPAPGANYGAGVETSTSGIAYANFVDMLAQRDSLKDVAVRGEVREVCQKKGCWMTLASATGDAEKMNVRFKDYGFFMPKTLSGQEVVVQGHATRVVTPVADLRHYAEDAGDSAEEIAAITQPREEIEFIATGVRVL